jgi:hypothetical protein
MISLIISSILIALAALCNAMMDTLSHHWYMFKWKDKVKKQWWNPKYSWQNKYFPKMHWYYKFVWTSDAWHLCKSSMIVLLCAALTINIGVEDIAIVAKFAIFAVYGTIWNMFFNIGYNKLFIDKNLKK